MSAQAFAADSDVTLVLTNCGRFALLRRTLASFARFNSYPIRTCIITEDSGEEGSDAAVFAALPEGWREHTQLILNRPSLGQIRSIDAAYSRVETPYIFHCEDDWEFHRPCFIEDSKLILESDANALQVWLRSYYHDLLVHSSFHGLGPREVLQGVPFHGLTSEKADWQGFSFNPGLRRLADYQRLGSYAATGGEEKAVARWYAEHGYRAVILENDAVAHIGWGEHVVSSSDRVKRKHRERRARQRSLLWLVLGLTVGAALGALW